MKQTCTQLIVVLDYSPYCGSTERETVLQEESPKLKLISFSSYLENHLIPVLCNFVFLEQMAFPSWFIFVCLVNSHVED